MINRTKITGWPTDDCKKELNKIVKKWKGRGRDTLVGGQEDRSWERRNSKSMGWGKMWSRNQSEQEEAHGGKKGHGGLLREERKGKKKGGRASVHTTCEIGSINQSRFQRDDSGAERGHVKIRFSNGGKGGGYREHRGEGVGRFQTKFTA